MPNPKKVLAAFAPPPITVGGLQIGPCTLGHILALESLGHPLAIGFKDESTLTAQKICEAAAILSRPAREARALAAKGPEAVAAAAGEMADDMPPATGKKLSAAVLQCLEEAFATHLTPKAEEGESPAQPGQKDSAGRSNS